jgi:hypothetical protein
MWVFLGKSNNFGYIFFLTIIGLRAFQGYLPIVEFKIILFHVTANVLLVPEINGC